MSEPSRSGFVRFTPGPWTIRDRDGNIVATWLPSIDDIGDDDRADDDEDEDEDEVST